MMVILKLLLQCKSFFDQAISGNWSYNPENYENNEVPVSVMAGDLLKNIQVWLEDFLLSEYI